VFSLGQAHFLRGSVGTGSSVVGQSNVRRQGAHLRASAPGGVIGRAIRRLPGYRGKRHAPCANDAASVRLRTTRGVGRFVARRLGLFSVLVSAATASTCRRSVRDAQGLRRSGRPSTRPVLKHGPRSLTCARVVGFLRNLEAQRRQTRTSSSGDEFCKGGTASVASAPAPPARHGRIDDVAEHERTRWDPKDGELCLSRAKPEETLVEARSDSDVQIDRRT